MEQLAWMYQSCAAPVQSRFVDPEQPGAFFPALQQEQVSGVLELISNGRVSYLRFESGRFASGYFCDRPDALPVGKYIESQFAHTPDGAAPGVAACLFPPEAELPAQAANAARGGRKGAPLWAAGGRLLHGAALAGGGVRGRARSTSGRRPAAPGRPSRRGRPNPCGASRPPPRKPPATRRPCSRTSAPAP